MPPLIVSFRARQGVPAPTEDRASNVLLGLSSPQAGRLIAHHARRQPYQPLEAVQRRTVCARRASRGPTGGFVQAALLVNTRIQAGRTRARYVQRDQRRQGSEQHRQRLALFAKLGRILTRLGRKAARRALSTRSLLQARGHCRIVCAEKASLDQTARIALNALLDPTNM
jgi:hypothetical protein